jgi:hypothetical protein
LHVGSLGTGTPCADGEKLEGLEEHVVNVPIIKLIVMRAIIHAMIE